MKWPFWTRSQPVILDDCETIDPLLSLYADGMASPEEARHVTAHLPGCDACRESLAWMQATQRALSARPVVRPPAALRARIAAAIAASSAVPLPISSGTRPARSFALRPAYAAAASLTVLGVIGYSVLREHPAANVKNPVTPPNQVAVLPPVENSSPNVKPTMPDVVIRPTIKRHSHGSVMPAPVNPPLIANNSTDEEPSATPFKVKTPVIAHRAVKVAEKPSPTLLPTLKPHVPAVKKPVQPKTNPALMANTKIPAAPVEHHQPPMVQPEAKKPAPLEAAVPKPTSPAPAIIEKQPIVTQDPPARVASNHSDNSARSADLLGSVKAHLGEMRSVALTTGSKSIKGVALVSHKMDTDGMAYIDGIHSPTN